MIASRRRDRCAQRGFTLLEMIVVVLLIGLTATFTVLRLSHDQARIAEQEASRFIALVQRLQDESILSGRTMGIVVDAAARRYWFVSANPWQVVQDDDVLRRRVLPQPLTLDFAAPAIAGRPVAKRLAQSRSPPTNSGNDVKDKQEKASVTASIIVDALGEITPFELTIVGGDNRYIVTLDADQALVLKHAANRN